LAAMAKAHTLALRALAKFEHHLRHNPGTLRGMNRQQVATHFSKCPTQFPSEGLLLIAVV